MTAAFRVRPHGLESIGAAIDEEIDVGLHQRRSCTQSSLHDSPPFHARARALCVDMSASSFRQTVAANSSFRRSGHFSRFSWLQQPSRSRPEQTWAFDQAQQVVFVNEKIEIAGAVAPVLLVVEVNPEPSASPAIEDVKRSRFRIGLNRYEQQN